MTVSASGPLPTLLTIFGIGGDLSRRKLLPSIFHLFDHGLLPDDFQCIGVSPEPTTDEQLRTLVAEALHTFGEGLPEPEKLAAFTGRFFSVSGDATDPATIRRLEAALAARDARCHRPHQAIFYLAVPPRLFLPIVEQLAAADLMGPCPQYQVKARLVIEKPFGTDSASAQKLNQALLEYASEEQIYRMDHYLGKETVQNILLFRFTNPVMNDSWNPASIDHIQVTAAEDLGVEQRAGYYDSAGALRDMVQSHCLALLTLALMAEPRSLRSADIHQQKQDILQTLSLYDEAQPERSAVRGQYLGYQDIPGISPGSQTETYVALRLKSSHPRWKDVPLFIRTGKRLAGKQTTISISFSPCKSNICKTEGIKTEPNILNIRVQPNEGIGMRLYAKKPGFSVETEQINMDFSYGLAFSAQEQPTAYERLIHDVIVGDQSLFPSTVEVMEQWRIIEPLLTAWQSADVPLFQYEKGSWGPTAADRLVRSQGADWYM
jgi:glucose-6-phosphate 1-dehydrogenase